MRRAALIPIAMVALLFVPGAAAARTEIARGGGITATLTWKGSIGITIRQLRLTIARGRSVVYSAPIRSSFCFRSCSPADPTASLHVVDLAGNGRTDVVVDLWSGGADCCLLEQVFDPTATGGFAKAQRSFGNYGATLARLGYGGTDFVSGDNRFYCTFVACAASGLPLQIEAFRAGRFHDVTAHFPALIAKDAARWLRYFHQHPHLGAGLIAAWAADEDRLGHRLLVARTLAAGVRAHDFGRGFVRQLNSFLKRHGYLR